MTRQSIDLAAKPGKITDDLDIHTGNLKYPEDEQVNS